MRGLQKVVSPKLEIVGWYCTGSEVTKHDVVLHQFFEDECKIDNLFLLLHNPAPLANPVLRAFVSSSLAIQDCTISSQFRRVKLQLNEDAAEFSAIQSLLKMTEYESNLRTHTPNTVEGLSISMQRLLDLIKGARDYVGKVIKKEVEPDLRVAALLADTVSEVPRVDPAAFKETFTDSLQDTLMIVYLTNLTRTQLSLAGKLQAL
eukprot:TRINITY_DN1187_c0_g1_i2.p1 TRINITY_DN1187_c0_g1~~TRINITY_DN1187_c0_g1_i2.p1  ORF type:complete len:205 (+),score=64.01 TRINITY_DN1187_c0_g1_i2:298-912(+)